MPMGRFEKRYSPMAFDVCVAFTPVASFVASTVAPGTAAPEESLIIPERSPLVSWANPCWQTKMKAQKESAAAIPTLRSNLLVICPERASFAPIVSNIYSRNQRLCGLPPTTEFHFWDSDG